MPTQEIRQQVNHRLEELYRWHLPLHDDEVVSYYEPDVGYFKSQGAHTEQNSSPSALRLWTVRSFRLALTTSYSPCNRSPRCLCTAPGPGRLRTRPRSGAGRGGAERRRFQLHCLRRAE